MCIPRTYKRQASVMVVKIVDKAFKFFLFVNRNEGLLPSLFTFSFSQFFWLSRIYVYFFLTPMLFINVCKALAYKFCLYMFLFFFFPPAIFIFFYFSRIDSKNKKKNFINLRKAISNLK